MPILGASLRILIVDVVLMSAEFFDDASPGGAQQRMRDDVVRLAKPFSIGELLTAVEQSIKPSLVQRNGRTACHFTPRGSAALSSGTRDAPLRGGKGVAVDAGDRWVSSCSLGLSP